MKTTETVVPVTEPATVSSMPPSLVNEEQPVEKTTPPELDNPLDELLKLIPDEHKASASKLIANLTGLANKRSPSGGAGHPTGLQPPPEPAVDRTHLRQDPSRSSEETLAPKKIKPFIV